MAGGKASVYDNDLLKLLFQAVAIANIADNAAAAPLTNLYIGLHTVDPGAGGTQTSSEATYTGYARVAVPRNTGGWAVTGNACSPSGTIIFPSCTGGTENETYFAIGAAASGTGKIFYRGPITASISVVSGVTPELTTSTTITES